MIANYHTHTRWCRHATGEIEDYVLEAIDCQLQELAITDHVPLLGDPDPRRLQWAEFTEFDTELDAVIQKYHSKIHIIKGFECEYIPQMLPYYRTFREKHGYELLILGQHTSSDRRLDYFEASTPQQLAQYAQEVCDGIATGLFTFLAHPDVFMTSYPRCDQAVLTALDKIFTACAAARMPVEINANGMNEQRGYPSQEVFAYATNYDLQYLINSDAHTPADIVCPGVAVCEAMAKSLGITVLQKLAVSAHE